MPKQALVKMRDTEAQWIYFKQAIQCFKCGWWVDADTVKQAEALFAEHICDGELYNAV